MIPAGMTKDQEEAYLCKYQLFSVSQYLYLIVHYIDECKVKNGGCAHHCHNEIGSFYCSCKEGYTMQKDGRTCVGELQYEKNI